MDDPELLLRDGPLAATVAPLGAALRGLTLADAPVATLYHGKDAKMGSQGDVLLPFPGRIAGGRYTWNGQTYQLPRNDKDGPNAIHGFVRTALWEVAARTESSARFTLDFPGADGYPFPLRLTLDYVLAAPELSCTITITNTGTQAAPVAVGFHPYFTVGSEWVDSDTLTLPFDAVLEFENLLPTGKVLAVADTDLDFRTPRSIGATRFNHCFLQPRRDPDGRCRIVLAGNGRTVTVWQDSAFDYVVLYTGDPMPESHRRRSLAIEPMSCASDGFNYPDWGLVRLEPGATFTGSWGVVA